MSDGADSDDEPFACDWFELDLVAAFPQQGTAHRLPTDEFPHEQKAENLTRTSRNQEWTTGNRGENRREGTQMNADWSKVELRIESLPTSDHKGFQHLETFSGKYKSIPSLRL